MEIHWHFFLGLLSFFPNQEISSSSGGGNARKKLTNGLWSNCGKRDDPFHINQLEISPEVVHFPEKLTLSASVSLKENVSAPIHATVTMKRKLGPIWIKIPCDDQKHVGSCYYEDLCGLSPFKQSCPEKFKELNIPCKCPVHQGDYSVANLSLDIPTIPIPSWLADGKYQVKVDAYDSANKHLGCVEAKVTLK